MMTLESGVRVRNRGGSESHFVILIGASMTCAMHSAIHRYKHATDGQFIDRVMDEIMIVSRQ